MPARDPQAHCSPPIDLLKLPATCRARVDALLSCRAAATSPARDGGVIMRSDHRPLLGADVREAALASGLPEDPRMFRNPNVSYRHRSRTDRCLAREARQRFGQAIAEHRVPGRAGPRRPAPIGGVEAETP
jgi:hypothetical protein